MSKKRKLSEQYAADMYDDAPTKSSQCDPRSSNGTGKLDPLYGQRSALPCAHEDDDEDSVAALQYLQTVRNEALALPSLARAPPPYPPNGSPSADQLDREEAIYAPYPEAYYSDGAYTALPPPNVQHTSSKRTESEDQDPQEAYYTALLHRFAHLQHLLCSPLPPPSTSPSNEPDYSVRAGPLTGKRRSQWRGKILKTSPCMRTLAALPQEDIIFGIGELGEVLTLGNIKKRREGGNLGAWAWGLLGRCREVGEMGSEDVGVLRVLGKQAGWCLRRWAVGQERWGGEAVEEGEGEGGDEGRQEDEVEGGNELADKMADKMADQMTDEPMDETMEETTVEMAPAPSIPDQGINGITDTEGGETHHTDFSRHGHEAKDTLINRTQAKCTTVPQEMEEGELDDAVDGSSEDVEAVKAAQERLLASLPKGDNYNEGKPEEEEEGTPQSDVLATLDMILTIVGELYGQRDLLEGRLLWDEI